jgi:hypothetical protein
MPRRVAASSLLMMSVLWAAGGAVAGTSPIPASPNATRPAHPRATVPRAVNPDWTGEADQDVAWYGYSASGAGDVNGDGYDDTIVGAYRYDSAKPNAGRAYVYDGSAQGIDTEPDWIVDGTLSGEWYGHSVSTAGDVNGDGYDDVIVGAPNPTHGNNIGMTFAYYGSPAGLSTTADWTVFGEQRSDWFGRRVHTAGDVNGDGYDDVIVGAPQFDSTSIDAGKSFVYYGSPSGLNTVAAWTAVGDQGGELFGRDGKTAGDVNADGYDDIIVGAHFYHHGQSGEGRAYAYYGSADGLSPTADWLAESNSMGAWFGRSVGTAGDVNGDGYDDVIVGAPKLDGPEVDEGRAYLYTGSARGLGFTASWTTESDQADAWYGRAVGTAGDLNGDGYDDILVGAPNYDTGLEDSGKAFAFYGSPAGPSTTADWTASISQFKAWFARSVASIGDVNGDGFSDAIFGAPQYDHPQIDEGAASAFYGSENGLPVSSPR